MSDSQSDSMAITRLLQQMAAADASVSERLFRFYHGQLRQVARRALARHNRRMEDEDDLVSMVLGEFLMAGAVGNLPILESREDALRMLWTRVSQRGKNMVRNENRARRGGGRVRGDSVLDRPSDNPVVNGFDRFPGDSPNPDAALLLAEDVAELHFRFLDCLGPLLEPAGRMWLQGCTPLQMAQELKISLASAYRKLDKILQRFEQMFPGAKAPRTL